MQILIVEDDPACAILTQAQIKSCELDRPVLMIFAKSLFEAKSKIQSENIDLCFLDIGLRSTDIQETLEFIREYSRKFKIVVLTGHEEKSYAVLCFKAGALEYIPKKDVNKNQLRRVFDYAISDGEGYGSRTIG